MGIKRKVCKKCGTGMNYDYQATAWICPKCGNGFYSESRAIMGKEDE